MNEVVTRWAQRTGTPENVIWVLVGLALALAVGSVVRIVGVRLAKQPAAQWRNQIDSLFVWWVLFLLLVATVGFGRVAAVVVFAVVSILGLREFLCLTRERAGSTAFRWTILVAPLHYATIYFTGNSVWSIAVPIGVFLILLSALVLMGETSRFLETAGVLFVGLMLIVFMLAHAVLLLTLPAAANPVGLFVFLIVLTESNDIAQALWGRRFGKHKIVPAISPGKTWEGFLLGVATTVILACLLAPLLTPFADSPISAWQPATPFALAAGVVLAVGGFFGDLALSAIKRECGVKDSGDLLPGQGGVLDRIDSLTFTAPLFYYFTYAVIAS